MKLPTGTPCAAPSVYGSSWPKAGDHPRRRLMISSARH
jgi:hypothetical protein